MVSEIDKDPSRPAAPPAGSLEYATRSAQSLAEFTRDAAWRAERDRAERPGRDEYHPSGDDPRGLSRDAEWILKRAEERPRPEQMQSANIVKIVHENAPNVFKTLRAILASRAGQEPPSSDAASLEQALMAADESPDPSRRTAQVVETGSQVPEKLRENFFHAAEKMLRAEAAVFDRNASKASEIDIEPMTGAYKPRNVDYSVEVNFDLFFSVSSRYAVRGGENTDGAFYEASAEVAARFEAGFSLKVGGRFLSLADMAEKIDPRVLDAFSHAVQGLAGLDDASLERFFDAAEDLFGEVEEALGLAAGTLDGTVERLKSTAESFLHSVKAAVDEVFPGLEVDQIFSLPKELDSNGSTDLLTLLGNLAENSPQPDRPRSLFESLIGAENARSLGFLIPKNLWQEVAAPV